MYCIIELLIFHLKEQGNNCYCQYCHSLDLLLYVHTLYLPFNNVQAMTIYYLFVVNKLRNIFHHYFE